MGHVQKLPLVKNPHLLLYPYETWWKWLPHEVIIFRKFHEGRTKNMDFLPMAKFWMCPVFYSPDFNFLFSFYYELISFHLANNLNAKKSDFSTKLPTLLWKQL